MGQNERPQALCHLRPVWRCVVVIAALRANDRLQSNLKRKRIKQAIAE
jgi:hypothetical protein